MIYCDMCKCPITLSEAGEELKKENCKCDCHYENAII